MPSRTLFCVAASLLGCGGSSGTLSVGGTYATAVMLLPGNTCGPVQVQDSSTVVTHTPGAGTLSLTHAGATYSGSVMTSGAFSVPPTALGGGVFTVSISGQFNATGFTATVHVAQSQPACAYDVSWVGSKSGPPNVIP
jgi:hypothetical protein